MSRHREENELERRRHPRLVVSMTARLSQASERISPVVDVVDISLGGALLRHDQPIGVHTDDRVVVSLLVESPSVLLLGTVARVAHGADFQTYVGVQFDDGQDDELRSLAIHLDGQCEIRQATG